MLDYDFSLLIISLQPLPTVPKIFVAYVACPSCFCPNDKDFRFCQRCGYKRQQQTPHHETREIFGFPVHRSGIKRRRQTLSEKTESTPYSKQRSSLEKEQSRFLAQARSGRDITTATLMMLPTSLFGKTGPGKLWYMIQAVFTWSQIQRWLPVPKAPSLRYFGLVDWET